MAKRFIGIDIDREQVRVAVLSGERGAPILTAVGGRAYAGPEELLAAVRELLGEPPAFGDRLATALPASAAFVRWLKFPFAEPRKVAAALSLELGSQLPVPIEDFLTDFLTPQPADDNSFSVAAIALRRSAVADLTAAFDAAGIPLHIVDVAPFALAEGLRDSTADAFLVHLG
jgi:general secretion pathway protein L